MRHPLFPEHIKMIYLDIFANLCGACGANFLVDGGATVLLVGAPLHVDRGALFVGNGGALLVLHRAALLVRHCCTDLMVYI